MKNMYLFLVLSILSLFFICAGAAAAPQRISLDVKGMDIVEALKMLASQSDLNIVVDKNVSGRVVVFLKDVKPKEAFDAILASNNLVAVCEGGITRVMTGQDYEALYGRKYYDQRQIRRVSLKHARPDVLIPLLSQLKSAAGLILADDVTNSVVLFDVKEKNDTMADAIEEMDMPLKSEAFKLNYARPEIVAAALQDVVTKGLATVRTDARTSQVIVTDQEKKLEKIRMMVARLDERTKEVQIDARIVQVNLGDKTSLGIDWEYVLNKKIDIRGMFGQVISTTGHKWTFGKTPPQNKNDFSAIIEALRTVGKTNILSSPRLTVTNNESAKILVGSKQVYVTTTAVQGQTTTSTAEAVNFVDVGVKLYVTPTIGADGFILMKVRPEVSSVVQNYATSTGNVIPVVETSEAESTILAENGATIIIGGLMKEEKISRVNKIPLLGDVPLFGIFFRNTVDETKKTELAIFLTCKILEFN